MPVAFDERQAWALDHRVALRPESFGALAYHFGTRRLSFLKHPKLVDVVQALGDYPTAGEAYAAVGVQDGQRQAFDKALTTLVDSGMIVQRVSG
jgi:putative mycofactocin binding protein MftB